MSFNNATEQGQPVAIKDEGITLVSRVSSIDFAGSAVTGTALGNDVTETITGGGGTPGGADTQVQFNDGGAFGGVSDLTFNKTNITLSVGGSDSMTVNGSAIISRLALHPADSATVAATEWHMHSATAGRGPVAYFARSRGTAGTPTVVSSGDSLGQLVAVGHDGTDYATSSSIEFEVDGTPGANDMPGRIVFKTSADGAQTLTERMRIEQNGYVGIGVAGAASAPLHVVGASGLGQLIAAGTATADVQALSITQTWNNAGVTFTGVKIDITNTASGGNSQFFRVTNGADTQFSVQKSGSDTYWFSGNNGSLVIGKGGSGGLYLAPTDTTIGSSRLTTGKFNVNQGTITTDINTIYSQVTWNSGAIAFTGWKLNVTDTTSAATALLMDLQVGSTSKFKVVKDGGVHAANGFKIGTGGSVTTNAYSFPNGQTLKDNSGILEISSGQASTKFIHVARDTGAYGIATFVAGADTTRTASTEINNVYFNLAVTQQWATGAITTQREVLVEAPTYGFVGASTITNAATFAITGAPIAGTNATITNAYALWVQSGNVAFGGGASAAELRFLEPSGSGTNYTAFKAQAQSANLTYTLPAAQGAASTVLTNDGSGGLSWGTPSASAPIAMTAVTAYETSARFSLNTHGSGTATFGTGGVLVATGATANSDESVAWAVVRGNSATATANLWAGSPMATFCIALDVSGASNDWEAYAGIGNVTFSSGSHNWVNEHVGFKLVKAAGTVSLYATQADAGTETASSALTTVVAGDVLDLIVKMNGSSSVDYYWRKNGGTLSSATNLTTNMPSTSSANNNVVVNIGNATRAENSAIYVGSASYIR